MCSVADIHFPAVDEFPPEGNTDPTYIDTGSRHDVRAILEATRVLDVVSWPSARDGLGPIG